MVDVAEKDDGIRRRDFINVATVAMAAVGGGLTAWPFISQMNPSADVLAASKIEVDLSPIKAGQAIKLMWQGKPVFIRHRTEKEIAEARNVNISDLRDPQTDADRVNTEHPAWLVVVGVCTHLGCIPTGTAQGETKGDFDGWFCPCHGSHYDTSGRIRRGPAPTNLEVPNYVFKSDKLIEIG